LQREWAIISRACEQREIPEFNKALRKADEQAREYYDRFHGYKATGLSPIPYFEKLYAITRSPFTPYPALISIPLQVFNDPTQWQALAHELGHYIYWNSLELSKDPGYREIQTRLKNAVLKALSISTEDYDDFQERVKIVGIWMNWLEETFADVCGTMLAGPTYVISGQHYVEGKAFTRAELIKDDERHPSPYLRPLIAIETLVWVAERLGDNDQRAQELKTIITSLTQVWTKHRDKGRRGTHKASGLRMSKIEDCIGVVVRTILGEGKDSDGHGNWVGADGQPADLGQLIDYQAWLDDLQRVQGDLQAALTPVPRPLLEDLVPESSPSFEDLVEHLRREHRTDKKVREALLSLELEEQPFGWCEYRLVEWVGAYNGSWKLC